MVASWHGDGGEDERNGRQSKDEKCVEKRKLNLKFKFHHLSCVDGIYCGGMLYLVM